MLRGVPGTQQAPSTPSHTLPARMTAPWQGAAGPLYSGQSDKAAEALAVAAREAGDRGREAVG